MRSGVALAAVILMACSAHADTPKPKPAPKPAPAPKAPAPKPAPKDRDPVLDPFARAPKPAPKPAKPAPAPKNGDPLGDMAGAPASDRENPLAKVPPGSDPADPLAQPPEDKVPGPTADRQPEPDEKKPPSPPPPPPSPPLERKPPPPPPGRVWVSSKTALDQSTLKATDVANKIASAYLAGVRRCYLPLLQAKPAAGGALTFAFTVNAVGKLADYTVKGFDEGVAGCVRKQLGDWKFPIPQSTYAEPRNARFTIVVTLAP